MNKWNQGWVIVLMLFLTTKAHGQVQPTIELNATEKRLLNLLNEERSRLKLPQLTLNEGLQKVARAHVQDLNQFPPVAPCNLHSWSPNGNWSACCYTSDHKQAAKMWAKPREIAGMEENGFEIAYFHSRLATPADALESWKKSAAHYPLISSQGAWSDNQWIGVGVAIAGQYAVVWFAEKAD